MIAHLMVSREVPEEIRLALEDAMEIALQNVPSLPGKIFVCPDVSGSMKSPVSGYRKGATSRARCIDVAALVAAAFMRKNDAEVLPFEERVVDVKLRPDDKVLTNARKLAAIGGGGTACSAPLAELNRRKARGSLVVLVSDNESWVDRRYGTGTALLDEWEAFKKRSPEAKLVCIDVVPNKTTQASDDGDILNVGGFSDAVFEVLAPFAATGLSRQSWVEVIEAIEL
jgi:60 kDa SS-A/Ro ribonucleoprotein